MAEHDLWKAWQSGAVAQFIIVGLMIFNIFMVWFAFAQKRLRSKLERDILAAKTIGSASSLKAQQPKRHPVQADKSALEILSEDVSVLKIDQAIKMLKSGISLEEIRSALDIEASYLQVIERHHRG